MEAAEEGRHGLTKGKAEALLRLTPINLVGRLGKYIDVESKFFSIEQQNEEQQLQSEFRSRLATISTTDITLNPDPLSEPKTFMSERENNDIFLYKHPSAAIPELINLAITASNSDIRTYSLLSVLVFIDQFGKSLNEDELISIQHIVRTNKHEMALGHYEAVGKVADEILLAVDGLTPNFTGDTSD